MSEPKTPPRRRSPRHERKSSFTPFTPITPYTKSPRTRKQVPATPPKSEFPVAPHIPATPDPTPRRSTRKQVVDRIDLGSSSKTLMFPLAHSTVGSGRVKKTARLLSFDEAELTQPGTPKDKYITEEMAQQWLQRPVVDEEEDDYGTTGEPKNPFLGTSSKSEKQDDFGPEFEETVTYINNKTGERIVRRLDERERSIKPKRLVFESSFKTPRKAVHPDTIGAPKKDKLPDFTFRDSQTGEVLNVKEEITPKRLRF